MKNTMTNVTIDEHYLAMTEERHEKIKKTAKELARAISINDLMRSDFELAKEDLDELDEFLNEVKDFAENLNSNIGFYGNYFKAVRFCVKNGIRNVYEINCGHTPYQASIITNHDLSYIGTDWRPILDSRYTHIEDFSYVIDNPSHINLFMSMIYGENPEDHLGTMFQNNEIPSLGLLFNETYGNPIDPDSLIGDGYSDDRDPDEIELYISELYKNFTHLAFSKNFFDKEEFKKTSLSKKFEFVEKNGSTIFLKRIEQERKIVVS